MLRGILEEPMTLTKDGVPESIRVEVSIGMAMYPRDGEHPSQLLHVADQAMYVQKKSERASG